MTEEDDFNPLLEVGMQYVRNVSPKMTKENAQMIAEALQGFIENKKSFEESATVFKHIIGTLNPLERIDTVLKIEDFPKPSLQNDTNSYTIEFNRADTEKKKSHPWELHEDNRLLAGIHRFGLFNWTIISKFVGNGRTRSQCAQRWQRGLDPRICKVIWSPEEDTKLLKLVEKYGSKAWTKISARIGHRSDAQCRYRFKQIKRLEELGIKKTKKGIIITSPPKIDTQPFFYIPTYQYMPPPIQVKQRLPSINCFINELGDRPLALNGIF